MQRMTLALVTMAAMLTAPLQAIDPVAPIVWTAKELAALETKIKGNVDPARHLGLERLLDSGTLIYRDGPSEAEVHTTLADFITVRSGEGAVQIGGEIVGAKTTATRRDARPVDARRHPLRVRRRRLALHPGQHGPPVPRRARARTSR